MLCAAITRCNRSMPGTRSRRWRRFVTAMATGICWTPVPQWHPVPIAGPRWRRGMPTDWRRSSTGTRRRPGQLPSVTLPPNGWYVRGGDGEALLGYSALVDGHRADYVDSRAYVYANGRGHLTRFPRATTNGQLVARRRDDHTVELFAAGRWPGHGDLARRASGHRAWRWMQTASHCERRTRGSVAGSSTSRPFRGPSATSSRPSLLRTNRSTCDRVTVVPGETISLRPGGQTLSIPEDAKIGSQIWHEVDWQVDRFYGRATRDYRAEQDRTGLRSAAHIARCSRRHRDRAIWRRAA